MIIYEFPKKIDSNPRDQDLSHNTVNVSTENYLETVRTD